MISTAWRPVFWEPVAGTGERIAAGVIVCFNDEMNWYRLLRDDVLSALYGKASANPAKLIETNLEMTTKLAQHIGLEHLPEPMSGFYLGQLRRTEAKTFIEAVKHCALMHSSLASLDVLDEDDEADFFPAQDEQNRSFSKDIRDLVLKTKPDWLKYFNRPARFFDDGEPVRFGFFSEYSVLHFGVLRITSQPASVKDARCRLWELERAKSILGIEHTGLILAVPPKDHPTLGAKQKQAVNKNIREITREANSEKIKLYPVESIQEGAQTLMEVVEA